MRAVFYLILDLILITFKLLRPNGRSLLLAETLMLRQQLTLVRRKSCRAPRLTSFDRFVFAITSFFISSKRLPKLSIVVAHSTVQSLHKALVARKYSILFKPKRRKPGPKGPTPQIIELILGIKEKNPTYGIPKIALLMSKLLDKPIDEQLVRRVLRKYRSRQPPGCGASWLNSIGTAKDKLWSMDIFRCESILLRTHFVMIVMDHYTREIIGTAVVASCPTGMDVCRAFAAIKSNSSRFPDYLSTDNDPLFRYHQWQCNLRILEIEEIETVPECPWSHPFIERAIGTVRRECLD